MKRREQTRTHGPTLYRPDISIPSSGCDRFSTTRSYNENDLNRTNRAISISIEIECTCTRCALDRDRCQFRAVEELKQLQLYAMVIVSGETSCGTMGFGGLRNIHRQ